MNGARSALPGVVVCLLVHASIFAGIASRRPGYLRDALAPSNPDAFQYVVIGRNLWLHGAISRDTAPPYRPDMLRTPVYPAFAGGLDLAGGARAIYLAQAVLVAGSGLLLYSLAASVFGRSAGFWAQLFLATDLMLATSSFEAMSEGLSLFWTLAACALLVPRLFAAGGRRSDVQGLAAAGLCLALAILARPVVLYLPAGLAVLATAVAFARRTPLRLASLAAMLLLAYLPAGLWIARNQARFSIARLTNVDVNNLVYFVGAGAYQVEHGLDLEAAQARVAEEFRLEPYAVMQNAYSAPRPLAEMDAELQAAKWKVLSRYPWALAVASAQGIAKATVSHNVALLADLLSVPWSHPGAGALLRGDREALGRLLENGPVLVLAFVWQMAHVAAAVGLGLLGVVLAFRRTAADPARLALLACLAYFFLTIALFGPEAYSRCRTPMLPFLYAFSGFALAELARGVRAARSRRAATRSALV